MSQATPPHWSEDGRHWWDGGRWLQVAKQPETKRTSAGVAIAISLVLIVLSTALMLGLVIFTLPLLRLDSSPTAHGPATPGSQATLDDVRACSQDDFDSGTQTCSSNRAGQTFKAGQIACSATLTTPDQAPKVAFTLLYKGNAIFNADAQMAHKGSKYTVFSGFALGNLQPLPGGDWTCRFTIDGQHKSGDASFHINGPTGPTLYASACDAGHATNTGSLLLCRSDESSISGPAGIACTALVAGAIHRQVKLDVVFTPPGGQPVTRSFYGNAQSQLFAASGRIGPSDVNATSDTMPVGSYTCTWSLDGQQVAQRAFSVK